MKIQLKNTDAEVLYELEESEQFPDYRSVLCEAIALKIDLTSLRVEDEQIDGLIWKEINVSSLFFANCSMKNSEFIDCEATFYISSCDLTSSRMKNCKITGIHISDSNLKAFKVKDSKLDGFITASNCSDATFYNSDLSRICFHTTQLFDTVFKNCNLTEASCIIGKENHKWVKNTYFIHCDMTYFEFDFLHDISLLYLWDTNIRDIYFKNRTPITEIINENCKVIYAIYDDVVWWKAYSWNDDDKKIFKGSLKEFIHEVRNDYPKTQLDFLGVDFEQDDELLKVCDYLERWSKK